MMVVLTYSSEFRDFNVILYWQDAFFVLVSVCIYACFFACCSYINKSYLIVHLKKPSSMLEYFIVKIFIFLDLLFLENK